MKQIKSIRLSLKHRENILQEAESVYNSNMHQVTQLMHIPQNAGCVYFGKVHEFVSYRPDNIDSPYVLEPHPGPCGVQVDQAAAAADQPEQRGLGRPGQGEASGLQGLEFTSPRRAPAVEGQVVARIARRQGPRRRRPAIVRR